MRKKSDPASQTIRVQQKRLTVVNAEGRTLPIKSRHLRRRTKGGAKSAAKKLFVGGPSWDTTDEGLGQAFAVHGEITEARVITGRNTGRSRGFGFVTFSKDEDAKTAMSQMDRTNLVNLSSLGSVHCRNEEISKLFGLTDAAVRHSVQNTAMKLEPDATWRKEFNRFFN